MLHFLHVQKEFTLFLVETQKVGCFAHFDGLITGPA